MGQFKTKIGKKTVFDQRYLLFYECAENIENIFNHEAENKVLQVQTVSRQE